MYRVRGSGYSRARRALVGRPGRFLLERVLMGGFKRIVLFLFSLAGLFALAMLALPAFGIGETEISAFLSYDAAYVALEVCLGMTAAWLVFNLLRSIFSRRPKAAISVMNIEGGAITVTRNAVASQAGHIVEALGLGIAKDVEVRASKHGIVTVDVHVMPYESVDITSEAPVLHEALVTGLSAMCGECLGDINVEFLEPQRGTSLVVPVEEDDEGEGASEHQSAAAASAESTGDITIPMSVEKEA